MLRKTVIATLFGCLVSASAWAGLWNIVTHGACCEANLAAEGNNTYVLAPILVNGNDIFRSTDSGQNWTKVYPPVDASVPFGIEGDLHAFDNDVIYFGTLLAQGVVARSEDQGASWGVAPIPVPVPFVANDQSWAYLGPMEDVHVCADSPTSVPYVLMGWFRIGSVALFSCDGGETWPIQTPLVGNNGDGPVHIVCQTESVPGGTPGGDLRIANPRFERMKAGRHGNWGPDKKMYWSETDGSDLYVCNTDDFGVSWNGFRHPLPAGTPSGITVTLLAFDDNGTMYLMHAGRIYVSYDNGQSFAHTIVMPIWGNADTGDGGSAEFFTVHNGIMHIGVSTPGPAAGNTIWYLRGEGVDTGAPTWHQELVQIVPPDGNSVTRLDFMQIVIDDNGVPTLGYTTPDGTTTASRNFPYDVSDLDEDGVPDPADNCPAIANAGQIDTDGDAIGDVCDNCSEVANPDQCDTNGDLFGNLCDADLTNDNIVNSFDLSVMRDQFGATGSNDADLDCDNVVNSFDLSRMRDAFGGPPGPSGLVQ